MEEMMPVVQDDDLHDAAVIAAAQKIDHYDIGAYGSAATFAVGSECATTSKCCTHA
jgi:ferritin-like metal-binding protein YciE